MPPSTTRQTLLIRLREPDDASAWRDFTELYLPLLRKFVLMRGVPAQDVDDVVQEVMKTIMEAIRKFDYDPRRGTFRDWLFILCRSKVVRYFRGTAVMRKQADLDISELPAPEEQAEWDVEYRRQMFAWASDRVRPAVNDKTWQAFWMTAVEDRKGPEVASLLGMSVGSVHVARSRVIARMREMIANATGERLEHP